MSIETRGNSQNRDGNINRHAGAKYQKVMDGRKHPVRGLWERNGRYYAQLTVTDPTTGKKSVRRVSLVDQSNPPQPVRTVAEAVKRMNNLKTQRDDDALPVLKRVSKFEDYVTEYLDAVKLNKRPGTIGKEKIDLGLWAKFLGDLRLNQITLDHVKRFRAAQQKEGIANRTVNLRVISFNNLMNHAMDAGLIQSLPTATLKPLKCTTSKRDLITEADLVRICEAASKASKNGVQFADYVKLMAYCGSRRDETLRLKWSDVSFDGAKLTIGADGLSKNGKVRAVDFNAKLEVHLQDMYKRRVPDSEYLFPSPQRGDKDRSSKTFKQTLILALKHLEKEGQPIKFTFHDCRHLFISFAVMSNIDFMTIAAWVGHQDGGILIGKTYGHLADERKLAQAAKLKFELPDTKKDQAKQ